MWKDPVDLTKRKPRRLRGTPANRVANIIAITVISLFSGFFLWYTNSNAAWVQRAKARVLERVKPKEEEGIRRIMFQNPQLANVIRSLNDRIDAKAAGEDPTEVPIQKFLNNEN